MVQIPRWCAECSHHHPHDASSNYCGLRGVMMGPDFHPEGTDRSGIIEKDCAKLQGWRGKRVLDVLGDVREREARAAESKAMQKLVAKKKAKGCPEMEARYLPIRVCSGKKSSIKHGYLCEIYTCHMLQAFFKAFDDYAVLSRKNGICFSWEPTENYGDYQEKDKTRLLDLLRQQALEPRFQYKFVYWNHCPPRHNCFVRLLRDAGFEVIEARTLDKVRQEVSRNASETTQTKIDTFLKVT